MNDFKKILMLGFGYTAQQLSTVLVSHDYSISGTTRDPSKIKSRPCVKLIPHELLEIKKEIKECNFILISIPPIIDGTDPVILKIQDEIIDNKQHIKWVGYLSSTSVYGNHHGKWVSENNKPIRPGSRGIRRIKAEDNWMRLFHEFNLPVHIFRLAGIYGHNRNCLTKILNGKTHSFIKESQIFSRIHVEDIGRMLFQSLNNPTPGEIYNLADDYPCAPEIVDEYAAKLLGLPPLRLIPFDAASLTPMVREFYQDSRTVSNHKFKNYFNFKLHYPSYKEGLASLYKDIGLR